MTIAIDFNKPVTTDVYTAWPTTLQTSAQALSMWLDSALVTYANQPTGAKRFNSTSGLFEQWSGSAWAALSTGYLQDTGDTMTGTLITANGIAHAWKDSGGTSRTVLYMNGSNNVLIGDPGNVITGGSTLLYANATINFMINGSSMGTITASGITLPGGVISTAGSEAMRDRNDAGFISFYNTAGSTRTGYLQGNTGASMKLAAENGASILFAVGGTTRATIDTNGNIGLGLTPSAWGASFDAFEMNGKGNGIWASSSTTYISQNLYYNGTSFIYGATGLATIYLQNAGVHSWYTAASGTAGGTATTVNVMNLDASGNLGIGVAATSRLHVAGTIQSTSGSTAAQLYSDGSAAYVSSAGAFPLILLVNGVARQTISSGGASTFAGGAATTTNAIGNTGGAVTVDCSKSNTHSLTLTSNMTGLTLSNIVDGQTVNIQITQDGTGSRTMAGVTAGNGYIWFGGVVQALSTAPNSIDLLVVTKIGSKLITSLGKAAS